MNFDSFKHKWNVISGHTLEDKASEKTLFVKYGAEPITQRQLNLYYYFIFISELLKDDKIRDVLEVGCGRGTMSLYLRDYLSKNVSLLDNVQEAIDLARDEFSTKGQSANFFVGDALDMQQFTNNSFDATISIGLAEHVDNV